MKTKTPHTAGPATEPMTATRDQTIARTVAEHQSDPSHRFHTPGKTADGRVSVAAGERLQRVRGRAHAN